MDVLRTWRGTGCESRPPVPTLRRPHQQRSYSQDSTKPPKTRNGSTRAWRATRTRILTRDGHRCQRCGAPAGHIGHIHPVARGGTDHYTNLQAGFHARTQDTPPTVHRR
jgi:5-methylcytosine-specific restriction endonuclease McrA